MGALAALGIAIVRALPGGARTALGAFVARVAWLLGVRRRITLDNLAAAFPEKTAPERRAIGRGAYRNMALAALESVCSDLIPDPVEVADWGSLEALLEARQPVLVASAHFGSWELFAEVMARRGYAFSAVVRPLRGAFNARLLAARKRAGVGLIFPHGAVKGVFAALKRGEAVVQLIDQSTPARHAVFVPFFGRPASTTPVVSIAALRTGAPVYVVLAAREGDGLKMFVEGPVPMPALPDRAEAIRSHTAALTAVIERAIRQHPEQWLWLHRRWKVQPGQDPVVPPARSADAPADEVPPAL